jgi:hypothetical protein
MAKRNRRKPKLWPASLDKPPLKLPAWDLGWPPKPDEPEKCSEFCRKSLSYFEKLDRDKDAEKKRLRAEWLEFLEADNCEEGMDRLAALLGIPAFEGLVQSAKFEIPAYLKRSKKRGAQPGKRATGLLKRLNFVEDYQRRNPGATTDEALLEYNPKLKSLKPASERRKKLRKQQQYLSQGRTLRKQIYT